MIQTPLHPSVDVRLFPGVARPKHAAAQMALHVAYRCLSALADHKYRRGPHPDVRAAQRAVDACCGELEQLRELLGADVAEVEASIARVEAARQALEAAL